jgi:UDP-glucose 4-epimerase
MQDVDYVFHEAAIASVQRSIDDPLATDRVNVGGTLNVLWAAKAAGVRRLVYAASSAAYESGTERKREDMAVRPLSPYGVSKLTGEFYCTAFYHVFGLETVALRYFNVFGPRQDPESEYAAVIPRFIQARLHGDQPCIYGDGEQTRDFTFVANIVAGNLNAMEAPDAAGQVFNIATGRPLSLNKLAHLIGDILALSMDPIYAAARPGDIRHSGADIGRAQAVLGYKPQVTVEAGLEATVAWFKTRSLTETI